MSCSSRLLESAALLTPFVLILVVSIEYIDPPHLLMVAGPCHGLEEQSSDYNAPKYLPKIQEAF